MLRHFANGRVQWRAPIPCHTRTNWEFYALLEGQCALRFSDAGEWTVQPRSLWLFAPDCSHGWANVAGVEFQRVALHFSAVPDPVGQLVRQQGGWVRRSLDDGAVDRVREIAAGLEAHFRVPTRISPLHFQRALLELSLFILGGVEAPGTAPGLSDLSELRIERALAWYVEHLGQHPKVAQVADAIHVSPSHLRRLFAQTRNTSPKAAFQRVRLERAMELMGNSVLTLEEVATHCGYTSASHLCREHKSLQHFTPTVWRKRLVDRFLDPVPAEVREQDCNVRPRQTTVAG